MFLFETLIDRLFGDNDGVVTNFYVKLILFLIDIGFVALAIYFSYNQIKKHYTLSWIRQIPKKLTDSLKNKSIQIYLSLAFVVILMIHFGMSYAGMYDYSQLFFPLYTVLGSVLMYAFMSTRTVLKQFISNNKFILGVFIITLPFLISRTLFYYYFNYMYFSNDSPGYFSLVHQMNKGNWPNIAEVRTLGYPLFVKICLSVNDSNTFIMVMQSLINLLSAIFLLRGLALHFYDKLILLSLGIAIFLCSNELMAFETSFLTESLYVAAIMIMIGFFLFSIKRFQLRYFVLFSISIWSVMMIRPAGLYLVVILFLTALFIYYIRRSGKLVLFVVMPFLLCYLGVCTYNKYTHGRFKFTEFDSYTMLGASMTYLKFDDSTPAFLKEHLKEFQDSVLAKDMHTVRNSWNLDRIQCTYGKEYNNVWTLYGVTLKDSAYYSLNAPPYYIPHLFRKVAVNSIKSEPELALKYFVSGLKPYFLNNACSYDNGFYKVLLERHISMCVENNIIPYIQNDIKLRKSLYKEFYSTKPSTIIDESNPSVNTGYGLISSVNLKKNGKSYTIQNDMIQVFQSFNTIFDKLFFFNDAILFTGCLICCLILSLFKLFRKGTDKTFFFILFIFSLIPLLQGVLVCSFNYNDVRHSVTLEYLKYFSFIMCLNILSLDKRSKVTFDTNNIELPNKY